MWKKLYTSYVRPLLEFAIPVWNPYHKADIEILERVQHRATKIAHSMKSMSYEERCKHLNLTSLSDRRTRGDLIQKFKIENNFDEVEWPNNPVCGVPRGGHRGHFKREIVKSCDQRHNFFNNRKASNWNILPNEIIAATTVNGFKNKLDDHLC
jgi:ribonuclease P/MRP protein subunit RPP40